MSVILYCTYVSSENFYQRCTADQQMTKCESEVEGEVGIPELLSKTSVKGYCDTGKHGFIGN